MGETGTRYPPYALRPAYGQIRAPGAEPDDLVPAPIEVWERCPSHMAVAKAGRALSAVCVAAMGGSHQLAKRVGARPAVAAVTGVTVPAAGAVTRTVGR